MKINLFSSYYFVIFLYVVLTIIFPTSIINKLVFIVLIFLMLISINSFRLITLSPFYVASIFFYGLIISFFNQVDRELSNQFFLATFSLLIIYPILKNKIDFDKIIKFSGFLLVLYTLISFTILVLFVDSSISQQYNTFFREYSAGSNGLREFTEEGLIAFHTGTTPFLFLSLVLYFDSFLTKKTLVDFIIIILHGYVISISGSRGTFFSSLLALFILLLFQSSTKIKIRLLFIAVPLLLVFFSFIFQNTQILSSEEGSNNVKLGHYESFIDNANVFNLLVGNGLGAIYYSKGSGGYKAHTEVTPIDMIRYLGIFFAILLYWFIIFPTKRIKAYLGKNFLYTIIFIIYVLNSMTNPTMFNSYGLIVVIWYWYKILQDVDIQYIPQVE
jgi:hypothetical protein